MDKSVAVKIADDDAVIENSVFTISFNLTTGEYSAIDRSDGVFIFRDAWYRVGEGGWEEPPLTCEANHEATVSDAFGKGETLRVWYRPESKYDPDRFLDITVYEDQPFFVIGWGVQNTKSYTVRVRSAEVLVNGELFVDQEPLTPKVLRGGAGADENVVEETWQLAAINSGMLTYRDRHGENRRRTLVAGGLAYSEFLRSVEFHKKAKGGRRPPGKSVVEPTPASFMTLTIHDPQGKRIAPGAFWQSDDTMWVDIHTVDPFESLERFGAALATANRASPNPYDFPTLCGWMASDDVLGDNVPINNSAALVDQMRIAHETGLTKYTRIALRVEPDYYCYDNGGDTQQGWWDDEHFARYGTLREPYETFKTFTDKIAEYDGNVFTYVQTSMPSNDFALVHPDWILNNDISLLYEHRRHARTLVRYDYSDPGFQEHMLNVWTRLGKDGVVGLKFDYPESGWAQQGGFDDERYTTVSAYRKIFQLCREGLGPDAYIHERIMGSHNVPCTDANVGIVDLQRVWPDASHFEPEMASRIGLRWYKQGVALRYYPDGKSFFPGGKPATRLHRRTFLTLVGLLSGRIEIGNGFGRLTDEIRHDLTRFYPVLPNGKAFRPVDFLLSKRHPEVYVYRVDDTWAQVILVNSDEARRATARLVTAPVSGSQADVGSLGLRADRRYHVFDFWAQKPLGIIDGGGMLAASLEKGEARVYAVREALERPQIIGTNRHVMCGMMEIQNTRWDDAAQTLSFDAAVVGGESLVIALAVPEDGAFKPVAAEGEGLSVRYEAAGDYVAIRADAENNRNGRISITFTTLDA